MVESILIKPEIKPEKLYKCRVYLFCLYVLCQLSVFKIGEICGVGHSTIYRWLNEFNIPIRQRKSIVKKIRVKKIRVKKSNPKRFTYLIKNPDGDFITLKSSIPDLKKCFSCGHDYLFRENGVLGLINNRKGFSHINKFFSFEWFCSKKCKLDWIFKR